MFETRWFFPWSRPSSPPACAARRTRRQGLINRFDAFPVGNIDVETNEVIEIALGREQYLSEFLKRGLELLCEIVFADNLSLGIDRKQSCLNCFVEVFRMR